MIAVVNNTAQTSPLAAHQHDSRYFLVSMAMEFVAAPGMDF